MARTRITRTHLKDFNTHLLREEVRALFPDRFVKGITLGGFEQVDQFTRTPFAGPRVLSKSHGVPTLTAQPGEIFLDTVDPATAAQIAAYDRVLADHVATGKSVIEIGIDQDVVDLDTIEADLTNYLSLSDADKDDRVKRGLRLILRR